MFSLFSDIDRGNSLQEISVMTGGAGIIISFSDDGVNVERRSVLGRKIRLKYNVVKKGGEKNGEQNSSKSGRID